MHAEFKKVIHQVMREGTAALLAEFYEKVIASNDIGEMRKAIQLGITATGAEAAKALDPYAGLAVVNITVNHGSVTVNQSATDMPAIQGWVVDQPATAVEDAAYRAVRPWSPDTLPTSTMLRNYLVNADVADMAGLVELLDIAVPPESASEEPDEL